MEKKQQLSQAIATVERQISEAKSETAKKALTAKLGRLKEDLRAEKSGGVSSLTTLTQARKAVKALDKTAFEKLVEKLSEKPEYAFLKDYSQDRLRRDALRTAKPRGYRFKGDNNAKPTIAQIKQGLKDGTVYYEGRPIRSDVNSKVRLGNGGSVSTETIDLKLYNIRGQVVESGKVVIDYDNETITLGSGKKYKVEPDREYTYRFLKTKIIAVNGIKGLSEFLKEINAPKKALNTVVKAFIDSDESKMATGGHVSKGEMVWNKLSKAERLDFLYENFTPQITPITQEAIQHKKYVFLPKNVKIVLESKYANVEEYAKGGGVEAPKYFKNGGQTYTWLNVTKMKSLIRFNNKKEAQEAKIILNNLNDEFTYHLVEERDKFVIYRDFSKDEFLLNIINSIGTDAEWVNVSSMKKEGSFESESEARKKFESLWENGSKTYYLLTDGRKNTFYVYSDSNKSEKVFKEIMATGGSIPNNYEGRTPEDIWNSLSHKQRTHFLFDHIYEIEAYKNIDRLPTSEIRKAMNSEWSTLDSGIKTKFTIHTAEGQYATGGSVKAYSYLPNKDISKIVLKSKQVIGKSRILDGAYLKGKLLKDSKTTKATKISKSSEEVYNDLIKYVKETYPKLKFGENKDYYFTESMIQDLIDANYSEKEIKGFVLGLNNVIKVDSDNEFIYLDGLQKYGEDYKQKYINLAVEASKNNAFELGLKYPSFNWKPIITKYKIDLKPVLITRKREYKSGEYDVYTIVCFVGKDIVIGGTAKREHFKDGKLDYETEERNPNEIEGKFNEGYWGIVSSKKEVIMDVAEMLLSQKEGYVKEMDFLTNDLGGVGSEELIENKIKFEDGGVVRKMYAGDAVLYEDELWEITEKEGELGIVYSQRGAWGSNPPFVPLSEIDMSQLTDMMGRKVEISKITYHAKGGNISNESKNLSSMTGASEKAIESFFNENGLDHMGRLRVTMGVGRGHLSRKDFATAIAGEKGNKYAKEIIDYVKTDRAFKMAKGGNLEYTYIPNADIEKIIGTDGKEYDNDILLDGAYVTDKVRTPKMSRTQFEEDVYAYGEGGGISKSGSKIYKLRAEGLNDFLAFLQNGMYFKVKSFTVEPLGIPDVVVTFETDSSLSEIKEKLREIPDSHVMLDTVKPINEYTGDREEGDDESDSLENSYKSGLITQYEYEQLKKQKETKFAHGGSMYATGGGINVSDIKKEKQKMVSELFEKCGVFFAFSEKQFEENKTPLKEGEKYVSIGGGGYLPKGKVKEFQEGMEAIERYGKQKVKKNNLAEAQILDELQNYECFYTGDISDVVDLFEGTYTVKQIRDVYNKYREENQEYALGGEITAEEREQALKNYPKLNF